MLKISGITRKYFYAIDTDAQGQIKMVNSKRSSLLFLLPPFAEMKWCAEHCLAEGGLQHAVCFSECFVSLCGGKIHGIAFGGLICGPKRWLAEDGVFPARHPGAKNGGARGGGRRHWGMVAYLLTGQR